MQPPKTYPTPQALYKAAAIFWLTAYTDAINEHDSFHFALSGGNTPKKLYELLASSEFESKINWNKVHIYFGDERYVPHDHQNSNFNMANKALLSHIDIPEANIHAVPILSPLNSTADAAATLYENILKKHLPDIDTKNNKNTNSTTKQFDLVLLGLGTDGHTASLFPNTDAVNEKDKLCCAVFAKEQKNWRITITFPVINNAKKILLLSEGASKFSIIKTLTNIETPDFKYPVQHVKQTSDFFWYADNAALIENKLRSKT